MHGNRLKTFFSKLICWSTFLNAQTSVPAEHILDLYCVRLSNAAPFCKNYTKLYFDPKHLEKGLNRVGVGGSEILAALIFLDISCTLTTALIIVGNWEIETWCKMREILD